MSDFTLPMPNDAGTRPALGLGANLESLLQIGLSLLLIATTVGCFLISTGLGIAACFVLMGALSIARPAMVPVLLITAFMFQNMIIASFSPLVQTDAEFDTLRGANFVMVMTAYAAFFAAAFQARLRAVPQLRPWLLASIAVLLVIVFYLGLGAARGEARDAIIYFRNTVTPLACFHVAVVAASLYRIELGRSLAWLCGLAVAYGWCELCFKLDFLALFNGDRYLTLGMNRQIETGVWEKALGQTGFVFRGLADLMTSSFFNSPVLADLLPPVWRIAGPNFHPISYAYALSIISAFLLLRGRWLLPALTLPLLLVIGSKGAMMLFLVAVLVRPLLRLVTPKLATGFVVVVALLWIVAAVLTGMRSGDYHVLGLFAGIRDFLRNPLGQGLGLGGNFSSDATKVDWNLAQATGATIVPVESAVGVMLYQMGIGAFVFLGFLGGLAALCRRLFLATRDGEFLFGFVIIVMLSANAVLQEEAFYSPLALGFGLLLVGVALGTRWRETALANAASMGSIPRIS